MRRLLIFLPLLLLLGGCVTPIVDYGKLDAKQIEAMVKDKTMVGNCVVLNTPYGRGVSTYFAMDKSTVDKGGTFTVDEQCKIGFQQGPPRP